MIEGIGWIGSLLLSTCGLPLVIDVCIKKKINVVSLSFLFWWLIGEILLLVYIAFQPVISLPLFFNYMFNILCITMILGCYMWFKKKDI